MNRKSARHDVHAPRVMDPADYDEIGYFDLHPEDGGGWIDPDYGHYDHFRGNFERRGRCDHCGAGPLRYIVVFHHRPSGENLAVGEACAAKLGLSSKSEAERRKRLALQILEEKRAAFNAAHPEVAAFLADARNSGSERFEFVLDIASKQLKYGELSDAQVAAIEKIMAKRAEQKAARNANAVGALVEGRREIVGVVVSDRWEDGYGDARVHKMLVEEDDGNRVWGSVPYALDAATSSWSVETGDRSWLKGSRVRFMAAVERSAKDEHFGFFKRPTKAEVIEESGGAG